MSKFASAALALATILAPIGASAASIEGHHSVEGTNPGGDGGYSGGVDVVKTGDTYRVTWKIAGDTYNGTGIGDDEFLAVSYTSGSQSGIALYALKGDSWQGVWTYANGKTIGKESWK